MTRFEVSFDLGDVDVVAHLARALAAHVRWCRTNRIPVPVDLSRAAERLVIWASTVQGGSSVPSLDVAGHDAGMNQLLLSLPDAAAQLGVSLSKLKRLVASGAVPCVVVNGVRRIRRTDLVAYVASLAPAGSFRDNVRTKDGAA